MTDALIIINESIASMRDSKQPDTLRPLVAGEINMAYKLKLIDYIERDELMTQLLLACQTRREQLHRQKLARLEVRA